MTDILLEFARDSQILILDYNDIETMNRETVIVVIENQSQLSRIRQALYDLKVYNGPPTYWKFPIGIRFSNIMWKCDSGFDRLEYYQTVWSGSLFLNVSDIETWEAII